MNRCSMEPSRVKNHREKPCWNAHKMMLHLPIFLGIIHFHEGISFISHASPFPGFPNSQATGRRNCIYGKVCVNFINIKRILVFWVLKETKIPKLGINYLQARILELGTNYFYVGIQGRCLSPLQFLFCYFLQSVELGVWVSMCGFLFHKSLLGEWCHPIVVVCHFHLHLVNYLFLFHTSY